jgi:hypothetical protein
MKAKCVDREVQIADKIVEGQEIVKEDQRAERMVSQFTFLELKSPLFLDSIE